MRTPTLVCEPIVRYLHRKYKIFKNEKYIVHVPNFGGLSGSEDRGGGDNSIQFMNFWRVGDKSFK